MLACQTYQLHPFALGITLPYSEKCHFKNVVTRETYELDAPRCEEIKKHSLILTPEAWRVIRTDIQNNCALTQCTEIRGRLDDLFLALDKALEVVP
jgi:hypothetical protein